MLRLSSCWLSPLICRWHAKLLAAFFPPRKWEGHPWLCACWMWYIGICMRYGLNSCWLCPLIRRWRDTFPLVWGKAALGCANTAERHMGRSLQNGWWLHNMPFTFFAFFALLCPLESLHFLYTIIPGGLLCSLRRPLLHPTISIRGRRRVSGTGNQLAGCLPGRPDSQHGFGYKILSSLKRLHKNSTHQRINPESPLIESSGSS